MEVKFVKDTFEEYLSKKDHISASDIKLFLQSPRAYYYEKHRTDKDDQAKHFVVGSALHEIIMEPHLFEHNYVVFPKVDRRTKQGKEDYAKFVEESQDKVMLTDEEMEMIIQMSVNVKRNNTFMELLEDSHYEVSCYTTDEETGLKLRMRPDILPKKKNSIVDIKSCLNSSPVKFKNDVFKFGYAISAAFYTNFLKRENYIFAALEKNAPYQSSLFALSDERMSYGQFQYRMGLDLLKWSQDNDYWCDYVEFEILKESYLLGDTSDVLDTIQKSELIKILD